MAIVLTALSVVGTATGAGMLVPQAVRLRRRSTLDGVSAKWIGVGLTMNSWWLVYAVTTRLWGLAPLAVLSILLYTDIARSALRIGGARLTNDFVKGGALLGWLPAAFLVAHGWPGAGLAIGLCYGLQFVPAAAEAWRSESLNGLSPTTWILALIEAVAWFIYGLLTGDVALLVGGAGGSVMAAAILLRFVPPFGPEPAAGATVLGRELVS